VGHLFAPKRLYIAVVAQSVERRHGKAKVSGSIPDNGSRIVQLYTNMHDIMILVDEFCDDATFIKGYSKDTIKRYRQVVGFFVSFSAISTIDQVNELAVRTFFLHGRRYRDWSANTFISYHKTLLVFFRWCVDRGHLAANPVDDIEVPKLEKRLPPKLTKQEALRLLEVVYNYPYPHRFLRARNHALFSTFVYAGLRKSEALNLHMGDVDIENRTIFVRRGKGAKDRIVPMSHRLAQTLLRYREERGKLGKTCPELFTSLHRNTGFTRSGLKRVVDALKRAAGIEFTVHKLRHTFATLMLEGGCDIYSLSRMLGHSDIKTTTIYLAASAEHLRSQMSKHPLDQSQRSH